MPIESGVGVELRYVEEVTRGTTPATPTMLVLRATQRAINPEKELLESDEVRTDELEQDVRHGFESVGGTIGFEPSRVAHDDLFRVALGETAWKTIAAVSTISAAVGGTGTSEFSRPSGSWITDGYREGMTMDVTGFAAGANNARWTIVALSATVLTVYDPLDVIVTEATAGTVTFVGGYIDTATSLLTWTVERAMTQTARFEVFRGVAIQQLTMNMPAKQMVSGTIDLIGMSFPASSGTALDASPTAAAANSPFGSFDSLMILQGAVIGVNTSLAFTLNNRRTVDAVRGSKTSPDVFAGRKQLSGTLDTMFQDSTQYDAFVNETEVAIATKLNDTNGTDFLSFIMPRCKYTGATKDPAQEGPVFESMPFRSLKDPTFLTALTIQRSNT